MQSRTWTRPSRAGVVRLPAEGIAAGTSGELRRAGVASGHVFAALKRGYRLPHLAPLSFVSASVFGCRRSARIDDTMDLISGTPFFPLKDGLLASYPSLKENIACDVAIIGGGITGALVGFHLADAGIDAVVFDRRDIGFGSTGASTSLLQYEIDVPLHRLARLFGEENAVRAYRASFNALAKIAALADGLGERCEFEWKESLCFASRPAHLAGLRREFDARRKAGFAVEWWNAARSRRAVRFPTAGRCSRAMPHRSTRIVSRSLACPRA